MIVIISSRFPFIKVITKLKHDLSRILHRTMCADHNHSNNKSTATQSKVYDHRVSNFRSTNVVSGKQRRQSEGYKLIPILVLRNSESSGRSSLGNNTTPSLPSGAIPSQTVPTTATQGSDLVRIVCISDTHNGHRNPHFDTKIRQIKADILVHAGDFGDRGTREERIDFWNWLCSLNNFSHKIFISGNMDGIGLDQNRLKEEDRFPENDPSVIYLQNQSRRVRGLQFYGCPHTPKFCGGFQYSRDSRKAKQLWDEIPADCDVLISHGPPAGIFDRTSRGQYFSSFRWPHVIVVYRCDCGLWEPGGCDPWSTIDQSSDIRARPSFAWWAEDRWEMVRQCCPIQWNLREWRAKQNRWTCCWPKKKGDCWSHAALNVNKT